MSEAQGIVDTKTRGHKNHRENSCHFSEAGGWRMARDVGRKEGSVCQDKKFLPGSIGTRELSQHTNDPKSLC